MTTTFRDTLITCRECGKQFVLTVEKQRRSAEQGQATVPEMCGTCTQRVEYRGKLLGHVKWFSLEKGYGFIAAEDGADIFFHRDGVVLEEGQAPSTLEEGQEVLYEVMDTSRGPQAIQVELYQG
jgi:CspA family cold shock protein